MTRKQHEFLRSVGVHPEREDMTDKEFGRWLDDNQLRTLEEIEYAQALQKAAAEPGERGGTKYSGS